MVPELSVSNLEKSIEFYRRCGFQVRYQRENPDFAYLELGRAQLMLEQLHQAMWQTAELEKPFGRGINLQIEVENAALLTQTLFEQGIVLFRPIQESWYQVDAKQEGQLEFLVQDPDGYLLRFIEVL